MIRVVVALPPDELERLDDLAERLALARSSLIRLMVLEGLEKREKPEPPKAD
jgi:metal-responsive CopG/Arc/MetJ family transcriptional regulator